MEKGKQRYCCHHFTGGSCVICHYNPWKNAAIDSTTNRTDGGSK